MITKLNKSLTSDMDKALKSIRKYAGILWTTKAPEEINISEDREIPNGKFAKRKERWKYYKEQQSSMLSLTNLQTMNDVEIERNNRLMEKLRNKERERRENILTKSKNDLLNPKHAKHIAQSPRLKARNEANLKGNIKRAEKSLKNCLMEFDIYPATKYLASKWYRPVRWLPTFNGLKSAYRSNNWYAKFFRKIVDSKTWISDFIIIEVAKKWSMSVYKIGLTNKMLEEKKDLDAYPKPIFTLKRSSKSNSAYMKLFKERLDDNLEEMLW